MVGVCQPDASQTSGREALVNRGRATWAAAGVPSSLASRGTFGSLPTYHPGQFA